MKKYVLPELPYAYDALEPYIDEKTMKVHHDGHHKKYVEELNKAIEKYPEYNRPVEELLSSLSNLPNDLQEPVKRNGGGHANHSLFWTLLSPKGEEKPVGEIGAFIDQTFGGFRGFKTQFTDVAVKHFSNGWAWLVADSKQKLHIMATKDHESPLTEGLTPLLTLDLWEHAYYLKHQNKRPEFVEAFWEVVNWKEVNLRWQEFQSSGEVHREWKIAR